MKDNEARGIVLKRLYDIRKSVQYANPADFEDVGVDLEVVPSILEQLAQKAYIQWKPSRGGMGAYLLYMARITADGVDVIEGTAVPAISITVDNSVKVHGSQNVQVGGEGNQQTVTMTVGHLLNAVDGGEGSQEEKAEAKSMIKKMMENPLVKGAFDWLVKSHTGS